AVESVGTALAVVGVAKASDICAYFVGSLIGRRRILPAVSPKKTWEGTIAGLLGSAGVAALLSRELVGPPWWSAILGLLIGAAAFLGGVFSSGLKRWAGAKDSASLIPEFGGILDLMDSVLLAAPVAVVLLYGG
ncbi:MAG: phosphatidate cytidylyltransferase, partial [Planctomycetota bacterium]